MFSVQSCQNSKHSVDLNSAHRIIITDDPFVCKHIGCSLDESEEWNKEAEAFMLDINGLKFEHNPHLIDLLLATGHTVLQQLLACGV